MLAVISGFNLMTQPASEVVEQMTLEEKVGQLFIVPASPERNDDHLQDLRQIFERYHIGGIIFKQGTQSSYQKLLDSLKTPIPLLKTGDAEWGVSMRIADSVKFPLNLTLGAIQDLSLIEAFGRQVGKECRQVGIDLNFAPVTDTNTNPKNPVIGTRSFGSDPTRVGLLASIVIQAMQEEGVLACAKHWPDHGDTSEDSHRDLPVSKLGSLEAFHAALKAGARALMTAHLKIDGKVVTFSPELVQDLIRDKLHFEGLLITDALNMKAITKYTLPDEAALNALKAGHDLLLYGHHLSEEVDHILKYDVPKAFQRIIKAVQEGEVAVSDLNAHVIRIIQTKQQLMQRSPGIPSPLITPQALQLKQILFDNAVTLVSNQHLPLTLETGIRLTILGGEAPVLQKALEPFVKPTAPHLICVLKWGTATQEHIKELHPDILVVMASPYGLLDLPHPPTLLIGYENDRMAQESVRKVLLGEMKALGQIPIK